VTLNDLATVSANTASGDACGIYNNGTLTLAALASISANTASGDTADGGGIYNDTGGTVTLSNMAAVRSNTAGGDGGGIYNNGGVLNNAVAGRNVAGNKPDDIVTAGKI
jgi:hypothetical protein